MSTPTLINLPPPPSDPVTPSDMGPGTPNSGTTSLSALSTTAIKDGHKGHAPPHTHHTHTSSTSSNSSTNTLDAERADRISRLAGLERVATIRPGGNAPTSTNLPPGIEVASNTTYPQQQQQPFQQQQQLQQQGYFDQAGNFQSREKSTVGSASATGSVGGRTTWASGSDVYDADKMSEDQDDGASSCAGLSDEGNGSLVGFGEAASSTISGPVSSSGRTGTGMGGGVGQGGGGGSAIPGSGFGSPTAGQHQAAGAYLARDRGSPMQGVQTERAKNLDGMTYDPDVLDTTSSGGRSMQGRNANMTGQETSDRIVKERYADMER